MTLSPVVDALIKVFEEEKAPPRAGAHFAVSRTVSVLAVLYEKARNAVEFRAEHLVRRAAIERILKRRIMLGGDAASIAENLTVELMWARYIDSSLVDEAKTREIASIINRYLYLKQRLFGGASRYGHLTWDEVMGLASSEIDETIVSPKKREALIHFMYQAVRPKVQAGGVEERDINLATYVAVERSFAQADNALIGYHLLTVIHPEWMKVTNSDIEAAIPLFLSNYDLVRVSLESPLARNIGRYLRKQLPAFRLLRDLFLETDKGIRNLVEDPEKLEAKLAEVASRRYHEIGSKVRRGVVRSIIYIFLTKMVLALALEAPFDMFISHKVEYLSLAINLMFPPLLLFLLAGFTSVPGADNTKRLVERAKSILYNFDAMKDEKDVFSPVTYDKRPILTAVMSVLYLASFLVTFGIITWVLTRLHFNIASQLIFVFFVALVSVFAYRIRASAKEYEIVDRQGFIEPLLDFFFLPILYFGDLLSKEIAKINFFIFLFDFILEAPLKVIFEVAEEWIRFIRTKKEEIL